MSRVMTATEIKSNMKKAYACKCGNCEVCNVKQVIRTKQQDLFNPLIKRASELIK